MRLTLRTLLAYLDDILEPNDADELAAKIRESDFASGLIHRIRNAVGRLRLSSPQVLGKGLGADANTVAEYLDNTLPSERVPDFEKVCLESDMMLSEVASCHEILTIVLGEHASVEPSLRSRVYELSSGSAENAVIGQALERGRHQIHHRIDAGTPDREQVRPVGPDPADVPVTQLVAEPGARSGRGSSIMQTVLGTAAVIALVAFLLNRLNAPVPLDKTASAPLTSAVPLEVVGEATLDPPTEESKASPTPPADVAIEPEVMTPKTTEPEQKEESIYGSSVEPGPTSLAVAPAISADAPVMSTETPMTSAEAGVPEQIALADEKTTDSSNNSMVDPPITTSVDGAIALESAPMEVEGVTPEPPVAGIPPEQTALLHVVPEDAVVAAWVEHEQTWRRIDNAVGTPYNQPLFVLPEFTPRIVTDQGLEMTLLGPAKWSISPDDGRWSIERGRMTISNLDEQAQPLLLAIGPRLFEIQCAAASTIVILEVKQRSTLGADPITAPRTTVARLWVVNGLAKIREEAKEPVDLHPGERWSIVGDAVATVLVDTPPDPASILPIREIDRQARDFLVSHLMTDEPMVDALRTAYRDRRTDVRSLAARGLAAMGVFEPLVETFSDPHYHASWGAHFDVLRSAVQQDAETAKAVQLALRTSGGPHAEMLYGMLWGVTATQLANGDAADLVDALEHRDLAVRVFASQTLRTITQATAGYRADYHQNRRRDAIQVWRRKLDEGAIRYQVQPENDLAW